MTLVLKIYRQVSLFYKSFYCAKVLCSIMSFDESKLSWRSGNCHNSLFRIIRNQEKLNIRNTSLSPHYVLQVGAAAALAGPVHSNVLKVNSWCCCWSGCNKAGLQNTSSRLVAISRKNLVNVCLSQIWIEKAKEHFVLWKSLNKEYNQIKMCISKSAQENVFNLEKKRDDFLMSLLDTF